MPIPFILGGIALAAAGYGAKKGYDAKCDFDDAEGINEKAERKYDKATAKLKNARSSAQDSMESLGKLKFEIYGKSLIVFVECFSKIKNMNFQDKQLQENNLPQLSRDELGEIKQIALEMKEVVSGGVASLGAGGLAGLAAYGGVGTLATASTGTAIAGLSGAAATNATLAWLGGGSLATGGFGMAGGAMVLGGIVAGPVLAVGGMMLASKAEAAKEDAYSNLSKAKLAAEEMKTARVTTNGIRNRFDEINSILYKLNTRFTPLLDSLVVLVDNNKDYNSYSEADKKGVHMTASLAMTLKNIVEAPVITEDGSLTSESKNVIASGESTLMKLTAG